VKKIKNNEKDLKMDIICVLFFYRGERVRLKSTSKSLKTCKSEDFSIKSLALASREGNTLFKRVDQEKYRR